MLALSPQSAHANATFELGLSGHGTQAPSSFPACPDENPFCEPLPVEWTGLVTVVTSGSADGTYTGADFVSITLDSNWFAFSVPGVSVVNSLPSPAFVTLSNGQVSSIDFDLVHDFGDVDTVERISFDGLSVSYFRCCAHHGDTVSVTGVLTNIPEPDTFSLLLAGLALSAVAQRARSRLGRREG
jgi:hypothetical protein